MPACLKCWMGAFSIGRPRGISPSTFRRWSERARVSLAGVAAPGLNLLLRFAGGWCRRGWVRAFILLTTAEPNPKAGTDAMNSRERVLAHLEGRRVEQLPLLPIAMMFAC